MIRSLQSILKTQSILFNTIYQQFGIIKFNLPDLGQKIKQGTIKKLYVKQGDKVQQFQKLADVASDKQFTQITAADSGIIKKIHYIQEQICQVGSLFLEIETPDTNSQKPITLQQEQSKLPQSNVQPKQAAQNKAYHSHQILATPYVRGLMKKYQIKHQQIQGSGQNGRILQSDVMAIVQGKKPKRIPSIQFGKRIKLPQAESPHHKITKPTLQSQREPKSSKIITNTQQPSLQVKKMSLFQKGMQKSMTVANTIPHLYYHQQIDLTECQKLRKVLKNSNKKVTVMGLLIKTFSMALKKYPRMNSTYHPEKNEFEYTVHHNHNISVAIDSPNGLVVPNIKNVQTLNLLNIQSEIQRLRNLSVQAKLTSNQLNNGTVCISNIGTIGGIMANPLILAPQTCIVAIGKLQTVAKYNKDSNQFLPRSIINISFGCDHRIIDGATVAKFSNQWKALLQNPYIAMAQMI